MRRRRRRQQRQGPRNRPAVPEAKHAPPIKRGPILSVAVAVVLFAGMGDASPAKKALIRAVPTHTIPAVAHETPHAVEAPIPIPADPPSWGAGLKPVSVTNRNTNAHDDLRLYSDHGSLELAALKAFMRVASSSEDADERLDARLVQLAFRASYHFDAASIVLVSAMRKGAHGKHGSGEALDFKLDGVSAADLARYVRTFPRAGIGIYTHPKTQYVHVDVRERSYHWVDGSPPGVTWREQLLSDPKQEERDASYVATLDLPEQAK